MMDYISRLSATGYPAVVSEFALPTLIAVFAFALPLWLQVISRIDDKYRSTLIVKVFCRESTCRKFIGTLIVSLVLAIVYMMQIPRCVNVGDMLNVLVEHSALLLLSISVILLIINVLCIARLVSAFYKPDSLLKVMIKRFWFSKTETDKSRCFAAISQLFPYATRNEDESLIRSIQKFYSEALSGWRKSCDKSEKIKYPNYVYDGLLEVNESMCKKQNASFALDGSFLYDLFLSVDSVCCCRLDAKTYEFIWRCLCRAVSSGKSQYVFAYWKSADQFLRFSMLSRRCGNAEIEKFREFNYVLGGLLLKKGNLSLLSKMIFWTNQDPPSFVLQPDSIAEAIEWFMKVEANYSVPFYYDNIYPYEGIGDIYDGDRLKDWTKRYISVLFLWRVAFDDGVCDAESLPWNLYSARKWQDQFGVLKALVKENLVNRNVMSKLGLSDSKSIAGRSTEVICEFENRLKSIQEECEKKMLRDRIQSFVDGARNELCAFFYDKSILFGSQCVNNAKDIVFLPVFREIITKEDLAFDAVSFGVKKAQMFEWQFIDRVAFLFRHCLDCTVYRLEMNLLFAAVRKMNLDKNMFTLLVVCNLDDEGIATNDIGINAVVLKRSKYGQEGLALYVVRNEDLGCAFVRKPTSEDVSLYCLKQSVASGDVEMCTTVVDLNENERLRNDIKEHKPYLDCKDHLLVSMGADLEFQFVDGHKSMAFIEFSQFKDSGCPDALEDIRCVW